MNFDLYKEEYKKSIENTEEYWGNKGKLLVTWDKNFTKVYNNNFESSEWFTGGKLNACYNCIDRHVKNEPNKTAIIYSDNDNNITSYTYKECLDNICKISSTLKDKGLVKGDCVTIYMPMCPEAVFSALACARLGIIHNVVFGGFSSNSLLLRIQDSNTKFLITCDTAKRGKSFINFWETVEKVLDETNIDVLIFDFESRPMKEGISIIYWSDIVKMNNKFIEHVPVDSEDILFYLYTSGSTGKPKGMIHTTGGYLVYAALTAKECFDLKENDVFACTADIGWITGHTYSFYGPLLNGCTTVLFGGTPVFPDYYRLFKLVESIKITQLYTAPTVVRTLQKYFSTNKLEKKYNLSSLRLLGSVGEPINKEAYKWFTEAFNDLHIVDTYWQTETGGIMIAPLPNTILGQPECASLPFYGVDVSIIKPDTLVETKAFELGHVVFKNSWPGISRGVLNDRKRYLSSYFCHKGYYFTGDEGYKDSNGLVWIRGRADDVINVSGHRLSTAELESATCTDQYVAESAVVAIDDEITGQSLNVFVVLKNEADEEVVKDSVKKTLRNTIGRLVHPKGIFICRGLPKTATGKIMRRVLRDIITGNVSEDISTCVNTEAIQELKNSFTVNKI